VPTATANLTGRVRVKVSGHLDSAGQRGERGACGGGEYSAHSDNRVEGGFPNPGPISWWTTSDRRITRF
jgi:hypothetical protein